MARKCELCGRGPKKSTSRSHSNIATKRKQYLNLQKTHHEGKQIKACAKCIKTLGKV